LDDEGYLEKWREGIAQRWKENKDFARVNDAVDEDRVMDWLKTRTFSFFISGRSSEERTGTTTIPGYEDARDRQATSTAL
jgi:hypothetical protein